MILLIQANDSDRFGMEPLRWQLVHAIPIPTAVIVCANNHVGTLDGCDWHHQIQLGGWEG